jgi:hypothetical protein
MNNRNGSVAVSLLQRYNMPPAFATDFLGKLVHHKNVRQSVLPSHSVIQSARFIDARALTR